MIQILKDLPVKLLDAVSSGTGSSFALPANATLIEWQTSFGSAPASITIQLQTSLDNTNWSTVSTSTSTTTESKALVTAALFVRAKINAISGGSGITVELVAKTSQLALITSGSVLVGQVAGFATTDGTQIEALAGFSGDIVIPLVGTITVLNGLVTNFA